MGEYGVETQGLVCNVICGVSCVATCGLDGLTPALDVVGLSVGIETQEQL